MWSGSNNHLLFRDIYSIVFKDIYSIEICHCDFVIEFEMENHMKHFGDSPYLCLCLYLYLGFLYHRRVFYGIVLKLYECEIVGV